MADALLILTRGGMFGLDKVSATTLSVPEMCQISDVYSAIYAKWCVYLADHGVDTRQRA